MSWTELPLTIEHPIGYPISTILTKTRSPTSSLVILCHGFLSNKNSTTNIRLTELLVPHGISTLRFDWQGMGESGGRFKDITITACATQLSHIIDFVATEGFHQLGLIGSSFGGLLSILVGATRPELKAIGLKCPVPDFPEMLELEFGREAMERWKRTNHVPNIVGGTEPIPLNYAFYEDCCQFNAYKQALTIQAPTLIVHGTQDELVPLEQIHRLEKALAGEKQLHVLQGANHHFARPEDFRTMTVLLADWMVTHLPASTPAEVMSP